VVNTSLYTGLSGLRAHQRYIDVIGNNLANVSTPGFRGARATFSDILSFTTRPGSGPTGSFGGLNPTQVGLGANVSTIDIDTNQGTFADTGRPLDVAIQGKGFFTLTDGVQTFYTRVGSFGIDGNRDLVDLRTGYRVVNSSGGNIDIPVSDTLAAQPTTTVSFQGNLPAEVGGPLQEIVSSSSAFLQGDSASKQASPPTGTTYDLSSMVGNTILVSVNGGAQQSITVDNATFGAGPVAASAVQTWLSSLTGVNATVNGNNVDIDTVTLGDTSTLKFDDGPSSAGTLAALGLNATLTRGSQQAATTSTGLDQLTARNAAYQSGDQLVISGTNPDGTAFSDTFVFGTDGTTIGDLLTFIDGTIDSTQARATLDSSGNIELESLQKGPAELSLFIGDASGNVGSNSFPDFRVVQQGVGPDTAVTSIDVVDSLGRTHPVVLTFTRSENDTDVWDLEAEMQDSEGSISQASISQIRFNDDGSFNVVGGGSNTLTFAFNGISSAQTVRINLGTSGQFDGVALLGSATTVAATDQDGYGPGTLLNVGFDASGNLNGFYTNGQAKILDTLRVSVFPNEAGLLRAGDTLFVESPNSDDAISTTALAAGAGTVRSGALENSNVDIAVEFVNLIEAQRGFQANSRIITTTDEILAELVNIVR